MILKGCGVHPIYWSDGSATNPPFDEFSPKIVFDAAFEGDRSAGPAFAQRRLSLLILKMESAHCTDPSRADVQTALNSWSI